MVSRVLVVSCDTVVAVGDPVTGGAVLGGAVDTEVGAPEGRDPVTGGPVVDGIETEELTAPGPVV